MKLTSQRFGIALAMAGALLAASLNVVTTPAAAASTVNILKCKNGGCYWLKVTTRRAGGIPAAARKGFKATPSKPHNR